MERSMERCLAVLLACCFIAASCVSAQPSTPSAADELWAVMDASQKDLGLFWSAMNVSGYVQDKNFATLAQGNYTIFAPQNSTLIKYAEQLDLSDFASPNVTKMPFPLIEYHVVKGLQNLTDWPVNERKSLDTLLTGVENELCPAGPLNVTKVSSDRAVVSSGGNYATLDIAGASRNEKYAVYGIDEILSPCCLKIDFSSLDLSTLKSSPQLKSYIDGVDLTAVLGKITGFLTYALKYIKENGQKLNSMPFTVILPYPDAIAAALDTVTDKTVYQAVFLNHIVPELVSFDTITAAGGSQAVNTVLDQMYAPFSCNNSLVAAIDPESGILPTFQIPGSANKITTSLGYKLCNGGMVYFADSVIVPCNLTDAVYSVKNNLTTEAKASQTPSDASSPSSSTGSSPSDAAASSGSPPAAKTVAASPADAVTPVQWVMNLVLAVSLLLAVL